MHINKNANAVFQSPFESFVNISKSTNLVISGIDIIVELGFVGTTLRVIDL
jgi:hypothetical protein